MAIKILYKPLWKTAEAKAAGDKPVAKFAYFGGGTLAEYTAKLGEQFCVKLIEQSYETNARNQGQRKVAGKTATGKPKEIINTDSLPAV